MTFNINWDKRGVYVKFRGNVTAQDLIDANNYVISNANFESIDYQIFDFSDINEFSITTHDIHIIGVMDKSQTEFKKEMKIAIVTQNEQIKGATEEYKRVMKDSNWVTQIFPDFETAKKWVSSK